MKWVLIVWVAMTTADGHELTVKKAEIYYPSQQACVDAVFAIEQNYEDKTADGYAYTIQCKGVDDEE